MDEKLNSSKQNNLTEPLYLVGTRLTNWNDATTPGWYSSHSSYAANGPGDVNGWIQVLTLQMDHNSAFAQQIGFWDNRMFFRGQNDGVWSAWKNLNCFLIQLLLKLGICQ